MEIMVHLLNGILPLEIFHGKTWVLPSIWEFAMEIAIEFAMEMDHRPTILPELVEI